MKSILGIVQIFNDKNDSRWKGKQGWGILLAVNEVAHAARKRDRRENINKG
jgi:hypothetical protein